MRARVGRGFCVLVVDGWRGADLGSRRLIFGVCLGHPHKNLAMNLSPTSAKISQKCQLRPRRLAQVLGTTRAMPLLGPAMMGMLFLLLSSLFMDTACCALAILHKASAKHANDPIGQMSAMKT